VNVTDFMHGALLPSILNILSGSVLFGFGVNAVGQLEGPGEKIPAVTAEIEAKAADNDQEAKKVVKAHSQKNRARIKRIHRKLVGYIGLGTAYVCFILTALRGFPSDKLSNSLNSLGYSGFALG
jgi:hypothetical protein